MFLFILYIVLSPLLGVMILVSGIFNRKIRRHILGGVSSRHRALQIQKKTLGDKKIVLFHAASAGEFEQLKPILKKMDREKYFILQTFFSPTIFEKEKDTSLADAVCYHPFDLPWSASIFLSRFSPDYYIITRHDIWPMHVYLARLFGCKPILINANLYEDSARFLPLMKPFNRLVFNQFELILTGSERLEHTLKKLADRTIVKVTGDSRFDQVIQRIEQMKFPQIPDRFADRRNIIFGSVVSSDIPIIFDALKEVFSNGIDDLEKQNWRLIFVPHEIGFRDIQPIQYQLNQLGISTGKLSEPDDQFNGNALIIDRVGILADLYAFASIAYVGAGFSTGVHSVIEPAVHGCVVAYGPQIDILDEAQEMTQLHIGKLVNNAQELAAVFQLIETPEKMKKLGTQSREFVLNKGHASNRIISEIFD
jgi:3-deoxy-D-manno-octulosonic-acid transferase